MRSPAKDAILTRKMDSLSEVWNLIFLSSIIYFYYVNLSAALYRYYIEDAVEL